MAYYRRRTPHDWPIRKTNRDIKCLVCKCVIKKGEKRRIANQSAVCLECYDEFIHSPDGTYLGNINRRNKCKNEK